MDQNGAVIPGTTVTATLAKNKVERTVTADADGRYRIIQLEPGIYSVKAAFTNFATEEKTDLTTIAGQNVHDALRLGKRQAAQKQVVDQAEDSGVQADAERERYKCKRGESG